MAQKGECLAGGNLRLEDDGRAGVAGGLERSNDGRGGSLWREMLWLADCVLNASRQRRVCQGPSMSTYAVDGGDGEALLLGVGEQLEDIIAVDDAGLEVELLQKTHCDGGVAG